VNGLLYLRLRDDPETVQTLSLSVMPLTPTTQNPAAAKPAPGVPATEQQNAQTPVPPPSKTEP
jgi:hypothetical protein